MTAKRPLKTPAEGANAERKAIKAKVHAFWTQATTIREYHDMLITFIETRTIRYNKRKGGLPK